MQPRLGPASAKEEALWMLEKLASGGGVSNLQLTFRIGCGLDRDLVRSTLRVLVHRHEVLRRVFHSSDDRLIRETLPDLSIPFHDRECALDRSERELADFIARPFSFDGSPMMRALWLRCGTADFLCIVVHHMIFDLVSGDLVMTEFGTVYDALAAGETPDDTEVPALPEPTPSQASLDYWKARLGDVRPEDSALSYTGDQTTVAGGYLEHTLSAEALAALASLRRAVAAPESVVLFAAYTVLLAAHGAGPELVVGTPINTRDDSSSQAIGYHVNMVPLRTSACPRLGFAALAKSARTAFFGALAHADVPVDLLLGMTPRAGGSWRDSVFRHVFNYVAHGGPVQFTIGGLTASPVEVAFGYSRYDLHYLILPVAGGLQVRVAYNAGVLTDAEALAMVRRFDELLVILAKDVHRPIGALKVWHKEDREAIHRANDTARPLQCQTVLDRLAQAARADHVVLLDTEWTFSQLWTTASAIRARLKDAGVQRGDRVGVLGRRDFPSAAAVLGVWLAEATCVPGVAGEPVWRTCARFKAGGVRTVLSGSDIGVGERLPLISADDETAIPVPPPSGGGLPPAFYFPGSGDTLGALIEHFRLLDHWGSRAEQPLAELCWAAFSQSSTTFWATCGQLDLVGDTVRIGAPTANTAALIADAHGRALPVGVPGQLRIAGLGVLPAAAAPSTMDIHDAYGPYHQTGRRARWTSDGEIELLGWLGRRVPLGDQWIDPAALESLLENTPGVGSAAVVANGSDLVAVVLSEERPGLRTRLMADIDGLKEVVFAPELPVTADNEVDYEAVSHRVRERTSTQANSPLTYGLVRHFAELLGRMNVGTSTHFFKNGGHSLLGARLAQRIAGETGIRLQLADIFAHPTPMRLAEHIETLTAAVPQAPAR